jgi:hypothetical protein
MATKILTAHNLATGDVLSAAIAEVGDLVLSVQVTGATNTKKVHYVITAKEGDNDYLPVRNGEGERGDPGWPIEFDTFGNMGVRIKSAGIDAEFVKVAVTVEAGATGLLTMEATITAKATANIPA